MLYCNNAIIASKPKHKITKRILRFMDLNCNGIFEGYKKLIQENKKSEDFKDILDGWIISKTGPKFYSEILFGFLEEDPLENVLIGPSTMFYPNYKINKPKTNWEFPFSFTAHYDQRTFI